VYSHRITSTVFVASGFILPVRWCSCCCMRDLAFCGSSCVLVAKFVRMFIVFDVIVHILDFLELEWVPGWVSRRCRAGITVVPSDRVRVRCSFGVKMMCSSVWLKCLLATLALVASYSLRLLAVWKPRTPRWSPDQGPTRLCCFDSVGSSVVLSFTQCSLILLCINTQL
jgi:hypothetical protein